MVIFVPVVIRLPLTVVVELGPSMVSEALPLPLRPKPAAVVSTIEMDPPATGERRVNGSFTVTESIETACLPVARPIVIELKPSLKRAISVSIRFKEPAPPPRPMLTVSDVG